MNVETENAIKLIKRNDVNTYLFFFFFSCIVVLTNHHCNHLNMSQNPVKKVLRERIKTLLNGMKKEERDTQSSRIAQKVCKSITNVKKIHKKSFLCIFYTFLI